MRIAIAGKGGVGKSTLLWPLALSFHQNGYRTVTIDADSNPGLALAAGVEPEVANNLKTLFELKEFFTSEELSPLQVLEKCSYQTPLGVPLITMARVNGAGQACLCKAHKLVREVTDLLGREDQLILLVDTAAGLEYLQRGTVQFIETLLVVAEPYYRSLETAVRIKKLADELNIKHIYGIANKVRDKTDEQVIMEYFEGQEIRVLANIPFYDNANENTSTGIRIDNEVVAPIMSQLEDDYHAHLLGNHFFTLSEKLLHSPNLDLSQRELMTIRHLGKKRRITMKQLAVCIQAALSTTTAVVDKLVKKQYVERIPNEEDRRIIYVKLSESGKEFLKDHLNASELLVKKMTRLLNKSEQINLIRLMNKIHLN